MIKTLTKILAVIIIGASNIAVPAEAIVGMPPPIIYDNQFLGNITLRIGDKYSDSKFINASGFNHTAISDLQYSLNNCWLYSEKYPNSSNPVIPDVLSTDGKFGPKTEKFVKWFQSEKNLKSDGRVGPQTKAILFATCNNHIPETYQYAKK
jgi:peptidoglycan hydrolase-like protein with peptidoglycan-binding domain